jgi:hypothetical protein
MSSFLKRRTMRARLAAVTAAAAAALSGCSGGMTYWNETPIGSTRYGFYAHSRQPERPKKIPGKNRKTAGKCIVAVGGAAIVIPIVAGGLTFMFAEGMGGDPDQEIEWADDAMIGGGVLLLIGLCTYASGWSRMQKSPKAVRIDVAPNGLRLTARF